MTALHATILDAGGTSTPATFDVRRQYNLGSATRDPETARHHQEEVAKSGISIAFDVPAPRIYPIGPWALTTGDRIEVQGPRTSGEVEIVLVVAGDDVFVGVGSDHTDRDLERTSIPWSKQACPNVLAPRLWRWTDVADHWDDCELSCDLDGAPYQRVGVDAFLAPPDVLAILRERADVPEGDIVVFCGTYVSVTGELAFGSRWSFGLSDPVLGRELTHAYDVVELLPELRDGFRVPLSTTGA
jgi:hypothetical protein